MSIVIPTTVSDLSRFEIELEFVQCLANPWYLNHLAQAKYLQDESFLAYLTYLEYWRNPEYAKFLIYPTYSLNALTLLQRPQFRIDILAPSNALSIFADMQAQMQAQPLAGEEQEDSQVEAA